MPSAQRIPASLLESAAERLVSVPPRQRRAAARQLLRTAPDFGIDLSLIWGTIDPHTQQVGQACLLVPAAGRTAMVYLSAPDERFPDDQHQSDARVACLESAFREVDGPLAPRVRLVQALVATAEPWARDACLAAGMRSIGHLAYLRLALPARAPEPAPCPAGTDIRPVGDIDDPADRRALARALERSYIDTLDCPGLCDLRAIDDVIESHRATGAFDPALWWVVEHDGKPEGALLLARYPDQSVVELVYIGLAPALRGRGLGRTLMDRAVAAACAAGVAEMTCAVDTNNTAAIRLYDALGFRRFDARQALVRPTTPR
jgi:ribosomal protein S18 acetylase RimI-like enzyme